MNSLVRLIRGADARATRFHTERGELMPLDAWLRLPKAAWVRARSAQAGPWMVPSAVEYLERLLTSSTVLFEFGSGMSTIWYAERCQQVISVEHDPRWRQYVLETLSPVGRTTCEILDVPVQSLPNAIAAYPDASFDVVVIDGSEVAGAGRVECVLGSMSKVRPGGLLVLDDSDRPAYRDVDAHLRGWTRHRFVGVKPRPMIATETTVYARPQDSLTRRYG